MSSVTTSAFYNLKADLPGGETYDFEQLKGKVVLVVNVASQWYAQPY
jgi:glutathione peroxidase-family protein